MIDDLIETVTSLSLILDEENERLRDPASAPLPEALVAAKLRHVGTIEAMGVRLAEVQGADTAAAARLIELIPIMLAKVEANAALLRRRMALCDELMGAIAAEAQRLSGGRSTTYGALGTVARRDRSTPISINSQL
ncbi:flagellar biosynthesis protein FlgN [Sphingomonas sp.]|uniref:flagellar biosynthesis protein FlgN n=1 Tax=Sphingomonas sp. TaxID=28214 RepID=UPI002EDA2B5E